MPLVDELLFFDTACSMFKRLYTIKKLNPFRQFIFPVYLNQLIP